VACSVLTARSALPGAEAADIRPNVVIAGLILVEVSTAAAASLGQQPLPRFQKVPEAQHARAAGVHTLGTR
jgi:hypothetical protein